MKKAVFREFKTFFMKNHISENDWPKICKTFREYIWAVSYTHLDVYKRQPTSATLVVVLPASMPRKQLPA